MDSVQAGVEALAWIRAAWQPDWEPVVVAVEDAGEFWRVLWHNRVYIETGDFNYAMGGVPLMVHKATGGVTADAGWPPGG